MAKGSIKKFGRIIDERYRDYYVSNLGIRRMPERLIRQLEPGREVRLWEAKNKVDPNWKRGAQANGSCVAWGCELACTCLLWNQAASGEIIFPGRVSPEAIYGGCRVEVHGGPQMGYDEDGAAGSWAADWVSKWGVLCQIDYSAITGNPEHDLRVYDGQKEKDWGYSGCGGKSDRNALDEIARKYPVMDVVPIRNFEEAITALAAGCPVTVASSVGFEGERNRDGIIPRSGQWPHQMVFLGNGWTPGGNGYLHCFNSWNGSHTGPMPGIDDPSVLECSFRVAEEDADRMFREEDSFGFSPIKGLTQALYDFQTGLLA